MRQDAPLRCATANGLNLPDHASHSNEWRKNNPEKAALNRNEYLNRKNNAIPKWYEAERIKEIYLKRDKLTKETGIQHHVDHIIPLKAINENGIHIACGLHCFDNLQMLTATENIVKNNKITD